MDRLVAARAGLIHIEHEAASDHRLPCSLCGMPCAPDKLTQVSEDQELCPACYSIYAASSRMHRARKRRLEQRRRLTAMGVCLDEERR